jgi:hypothetical protein
MDQVRHLPLFWGIETLSMNEIKLCLCCSWLAFVRIDAINSLRSKLLVEKMRRVDNVQYVDLTDVSPQTQDPSTTQAIRKIESRRIN